MNVAEAGRRRLDNLLLAQPEPRAADAVVRHLLAMQAQDYEPAKWSIAQRCRKLSNGDIEAAIASGLILRTHVLRPTWHVVARDDIRWLSQLTGPRILRGIAPRLLELGLDAPTLAEAQGHIAAALEGDRHLTRDEVGLELQRGGIDVQGQRLPYVLMHSELDGMICSGRPRAGKQTFALLDDRAPMRSSFDRGRAIVDLVRRYLTSHGPATVGDLRWWSSLTAADIKEGLNGLGSEVSSFRLDALTLWWIGDAAGGPAASDQALLLQTYDEAVVGYRDSRFLGDPRATRAIAAWKDRSIPSGLVLIRGRIAGHWRRRVEPRRVGVEVVLYARPGRAERDLLQAEAEALGRFLGRPAELRIATL